ncbi:hypothetical protein B0O99DRAFT_680932 [Bisporella sp. PMI_857]|nr:hypothetical protein B0O99DRAFT_680932 [Bisporella sp. PMI_857]
MSDHELDQEWKPNNRPQSTMAKSFSLALNDLFKIDNSVADLDAAVSEKKHKVSTQTSELEALEARLKATEERLKLVAQSSPSGRSGRSSPHQRAPLSPTTFSQDPEEGRRQIAGSPLAGRFGNDVRGGSRPTTGRSDKGQAVPGALPPTPGASEGEDSEREYVVVRKADAAKDGDANKKSD